MSLADSLREPFDWHRSPGRPRKPGTVDRTFAMGMRTLLIPALSEATLESYETTWPFQMKYIVFPRSITVGPDDVPRLTWIHPVFNGGRAPACFFDEMSAAFVQLNPLRDQWLEVGEKIEIRLYNESREPIEVRGAIFGICEVPEEPFTGFPTKEARSKILKKLRTE